MSRDMYEAIEHYWFTDRLDCLPLRDLIQADGERRGRAWTELVRRQDTAQQQAERADTALARVVELETDQSRADDIILNLRAHVAVLEAK